MIKDNYLRCKWFLKYIIKGYPPFSWLKIWKQKRTISQSDEIKKCILRHLPDVSDKELELLVSEIQKLARKDGFDVYEYFLYDFLHKSTEERLEYISDINRLQITESLNAYRNQIIFDDKSKTYDVFRKYYKRQVCVVKKGSLKELKQFLGFCETNKIFFVKPLYGSLGSGTQIYDLNSFNEGIEILAERLVSSYCRGGNLGFIAEQLITQDSRMAAFHPCSVNTVRISTLISKNGVEIIHPFMRMGRNNSIVDNAGAGGIICAINPENGTIIAAADEQGIDYLRHPDTDIPIVGYEIPEWNKAIAMAKELASIVKGNRYAGWDLALTDNNDWCMVEGNARGQFVWQIPLKKGFKKELESLLHDDK